MVGEDKTAVINIMIEKDETKEIDLWPQDIEFKNIPQSLKATINSTGPITVQIMGTKDELEKLSRFTIKPYIDIAGLYQWYL